MDFFQRLRDHLTESPCIAVCKMDPANGLCTGCFRTIQEIAGWSTLTRQEKLAVNEEAAARKARSLKDG